MKIMGVTVAVIVFLILIGGMVYIWILVEKAGKQEEKKELSDSEAVQCALELYQEKKNLGMNFSSQCLGSCGNYAVDIVHVPRTSEDNLEKNQCKNYIEGKVIKFIELDKDGNIFRVV